MLSALTIKLGISGRSSEASLVFNDAVGPPIKIATGYNIITLVLKLKILKNYFQKLVSKQNLPFF